MAISVDYSEVWAKDWPSYAGFEAERLLTCAYADRYILAGEIMIYPDAIYPHVTCYALAKRCFIEPVMGKVLPTSGDQTKALYEKALVHVYYDTKRYREAAGVLLAEELAPSMDALPVQLAEGASVTWENSGDPVTMQYVTHRLNLACEYTLSYYFLAAAPAAMLNLVGFINYNPVQTKMMGLVFPSQTLLYQPGRIQDTVLTNGSVKFHVTHRCAYRPNWTFVGGNWVPGGWNYFWNPVGEPGDGSGRLGAFEQILIDGKPYRQYIPTTFQL